MKNSRLSNEHYASVWKTPKGASEFNDMKTVNRLGIEYAVEQDPAKKKEKLEHLVKCFHPYLMKYKDMIVLGHVPTEYNTDARKFLNFFLPKGPKHSKSDYSSACKHLHLAFKGQDADEVYDILTFQLVRTIVKYDPFYADKVREVIDVITKDFPNKIFANDDIRKRVPHDPQKSIKFLSKNKFIIAVKTPSGKLKGYRKGENWPPGHKFLNSGPVGFTGFLQRYFGYHLREYIEHQMDQIENRFQGLQLGHGNDGNPIDGDELNSLIPKSFEGFEYDRWLERQSLPSPDEDASPTDLPTGEEIRAEDRSLIERGMDISTMNMEWVNATTDKLFHNLTRNQRYILYLYYKEDYSWGQISESTGMSTNEVKSEFQEVMTYLRFRAGTEGVDKAPIEL